MAEENANANVIEVFPGSGGVFTFPFDTNINEFTSKIEGPHVIINTDEGTIKIMYGAIFTALGHEYTLQDKNGDQIKLNEIDHIGEDLIFFDPIDQVYDKELLKEALAKEVIEADKLESSEQQEKLQKVIEELEDKIEELQTTEVDDEESAEPSIEEISDDINAFEASSLTDAVNDVEELLTLKDIVNELVQTPEEIEQELSDVEIEPISQGANNENVEIPIDEIGPLLDWWLTEETDSGRSSTDLHTNVVSPEISGSTESNTQVSLYSDDGELIDETTSSSDGDFTFTLDPAELEEGQNSFKIIAVDEHGNSSDLSRSINLDTTSSVTLSIQNDEGGSDGIIGDERPSFYGTAETNSEVIVRVYDSDDNILWVSETIFSDNNGQWATPEAQLRNYDDGEYRVEATATDNAANEVTETIDFVIDTVTVIPTIAINQEQVGSDNHTNHQDLEFFGTAEKNSILNLSIISKSTNEILLEIEVQVDDEGNWIYRMSDVDFPDSEYEVSIFTIDEAENRSEEVSLEYVLDTEAPVMVWSIGSEMDTGAHDDDLITNLNNIIIDGITEPNTLVSLYSQEGEFIEEVLSNELGEFEFSLTEELLVEGSNTFTVTASDMANNVTEVTHSIMLDTHSIITVSIEENPDASRENIYNDPSPTIHGTAEENARVILRIYNELSELIWTSNEIEVDASREWTIPDDDLQDLVDGEYTIEATSTDIAGNVNTATKNITIDTEAPDVNWELSSETDSGTPNDQTTNINTPIIHGQIDPTDRLTVEDLDGNALENINIIVDESGTWTAEFSELPDGAHTVVVKVTDSAGNVGLLEKIITIDTIPPDPTDILIFGSSVDEFITSSGSTALSGNSESNSQIILQLNGDSLAEPIEIIIQADEEGAWSYVFDFDDYNIPEGTYTLDAIARDAAGNLSESDSVELIIDRDALAPTITISPESDTGISNDDLITKDNTPKFVGTAEPHSTVTLIINGSEYAQVVVGEDGLWEYQVPDDIPFDDGEYTVEAYITDRIDNISEREEITLTIDATPPVTPPAYSVDTLYSNDSQFVFSGDDVPEGHKLFLIIKIDGEADQVFEITVDEDGSWSQSLYPAIDFVDGQYHLSLKYEDVAGNMSEESDPTTLEISSESIDPPHSVNLVDGDTGASASDGITNEQQPTVQVTAPDEATEVRVLYSYLNNDDQIITKEANAIQNADGTWNAILDIDNAGRNLSDGAEVTVNAVAEDKYGNLAESEDDLTIIYDEFVEHTHVEIIASESQSITNDNQPEFRLTVDEQVDLQVGLYRDNILIHQIDGLILAEGTPTDINFWTDNPALNNLDDGVYQVKTLTTDSAGNQQETVFSFTVDTVAPEQTTLELDVESQGLFSDLTNTFTPELVGRAEPSSIIKIYNGDPNNGGSLLGEVLADENGDWELEISLSEVAGEYSLYTVTSDQAGNDTYGSNPFEIDISVEQPPEALIMVDELVHPVLPGNIDNEHASQVVNPKFKLTNLPADETILLTISQGDDIIFQQNVLVDEFGEVLFNQDGSEYALDFENQGSNQFSVDYVDQYGNQSLVSDPVNFFIDDIPPEAPTVELTNEAVADLDGVSVFNTRTLDFEGEGELNSELRIQIRKIGTSDWITYTSLIVGGNGQWSLADNEIEVLLSEDGDYEYRVLSMDDVENQTASDEATRFLVDTVSEFDFVSEDKITNAETEMAAVVEDGSTVNILSISLDGELLSIDTSSTPDGTIVDDDWTLDLASFLPPSALDDDMRPNDGTYTISLEVTDAYQNVAREDITIEIKSSIETPELNMLIQDEGSMDGSSTEYAGQVLLTFDSTPILVGTAEAYARIFITSTFGISQTSADENGNWEVELSSLEHQADQDVTLTIIAQDDFGNANISNVTVHYDDGIA